jgi:hypothetical protein
MILQCNKLEVIYFSVFGEIEIYVVRKYQYKVSIEKKKTTACESFTGLKMRSSFYLFINNKFELIKTFKTVDELNVLEI